MLRKHVNSLEKKELDFLPFYSWECLTLQLSHRDVDLVIRNESQMNCLLKLLIHSMRTMDGHKGTADKMLEAMNKQSKEEYLKHTGKQLISESVAQKIKQSNEHLLFRKVYLKYLILRIRAKISFMALKKRQTVTELFVQTILRCYNEQQALGLIRLEDPETMKRRGEMFQ